jgi:tetratricopeptide (TPR) repeat protein
LDEVFRCPIDELLNADDSRAASHGTGSHFSRLTQDALYTLCARLLTDDTPDAIIEALTHFAYRLRIDDLYALALDGLLVLSDALDRRNDERADEHWCIAGILAMNAEDLDTVDTILRILETSGGCHATEWVWILESRRAFLHGNLPEAERIARAAISVVDGATPSKLASLAYHSLGISIGAQGRDREATIAMFESYRLAADELRAQWALVCLATGLFNLGRIDAAADCCALLANAENANIRAGSGITAVRIAARRGAVTEVARLRSELESLLDRQILLPQSASTICYMLGAALHHVGDHGGAVASWSRGLNVARSYHINQLLYLLDVAIAKGHADSFALGPLPLPDIGESPTDAVSGLARVELRLHVDRVAHEMEVMT